MKELIDKLKTELATIGGFQEVFMYRGAEPKEYPALICNWESSNNSFETNQENMRVATFKIYAIVNVSGKSQQSIDEVVIPKLYDKLSAYFDENWNGNTVEGHRTWSVLSLANSSMAIEDKNKIAYLDCVLEIKYLKDN